MTKKLHRVFVTLELETPEAVESLRDRKSWEGLIVGRVIQVQANRVGLYKGNPVFPRRKSRKKA